MRKHEAKKWIEKNGLTARQALDLLDNEPKTDKPSRVNKGIPKSHIVGVLTSVVEWHGDKYGDSSNMAKTKMGLLAAITVIQECKQNKSKKAN